MHELSYELSQCYVKGSWIKIVKIHQYVPSTLTEHNARALIPHSY